MTCTDTVASTTIDPERAPTQIAVQKQCLDGDGRTFEDLQYPPTHCIPKPINTLQQPQATDSSTPCSLKLDSCQTTSCRLYMPRAIASTDTKNYYSVIVHTHRHRSTCKSIQNNETQAMETRTCLQNTNYRILATHSCLLILVLSMHIIYYILAVRKQY